MEKIRLLFIQEKKIKKGKMLTLGDMIENEVPDTYKIDYVSAKENIFDKVKKFGPQIVFIGDSKAYDIFDLINKIKGLDARIVIFVNIVTDAESEHKTMDKLKKFGVYKCYSSQLSLDSLIHDMFVSLNME